MSLIYSGGFVVSLITTYHGKRYRAVVFLIAGLVHYTQANSFETGNCGTFGYTFLVQTNLKK